jgi:hypothetical protein
MKWTIIKTKSETKRMDRNQFHYSNQNMKETAFVAFAGKDTRKHAGGGGGTLNTQTDRQNIGDVQIKEHIYRGGRKGMTIT